MTDRIPGLENVAVSRLFSVRRFLRPVAVGLINNPELFATYVDSSQICVLVVVSVSTDLSSIGHFHLTFLLPDIPP